MSTNRGARWFFWMLYFTVGGAILLTSAFLSGSFQTGNGEPGGVAGAFFYMGFFGMGLGITVAVILMFVLGDDGLTDVDEDNKVLRVSVLIAYGIALVLFAVLTFAFQWYGVSFLLHVNGKTAPMLLFLFYVMVCGVPGYYIFLQFMDRFSYVGLGQILGLGLLSTLFSALCALTPLLFPVFEFCRMRAFKPRKTYIRVISYVISGLLVIACIIPMFFL